MTWRIDLLHAIFCPRDVELILKIPLSCRRPPDVLIWAGTKRGIFSVKSAYRLQVTNQNSQAASSSSSMMAQNLWSSLWAVQVPPKVKLFIWKACQNIIPTQTKLFEKGITHSYSCLWCEDEPETSDHVLWGCEFAQKVWNSCPVPIGIHQRSLKLFTDVIGSFISDLQTPVIEIAFTTAWALWKARNETVWEAKVPGVDAICQEAVALASDFLEAKSKVMVTTGGLGGPFRWQRPPADVWKLNMACHSSSISSRIGLGILIRDSEGAVMAVLEDSLMRNNELLQVHAKAVLVALKFAYDVGLRFLLVEVENQELCSLIQAGSPCFDPIGVIVDDICSWIPLFSSICFGVSKKICNKAAQALATEAASSLLLQVWLDDHPACITSIIHDDIRRRPSAPSEDQLPSTTRRRPSAPSEDQLPSTAHNSLVTRLRSILIFYGNQVRHLTRSTPHRAQVSSANPGDEALAASPSTMHELATTCQMKGHKPSMCPKIQRPLEGHVDD
jgi:hypothetical protein